MFQTYRNMDGVFRQMRRMAIGMLVACVVISSLAIYLGFAFARQAQGRIYILASGKAMEAFAADRRDNVPVEARDHIRAFHELFFSLDPDEKVITAHVRRAFYLADGSAKRLYDNLKESGYISGLISGNMSQVARIDSVVLDLQGQPYRFRCYATESIIRATTITTRALVTTGWLRNTERSDNNPHGFIIEKLEILDNRDLRVENRNL